MPPRHLSSLSTKQSHCQSSSIHPPIAQNSNIYLKVDQSTNFQSNSIETMHFTTFVGATLVTAVAANSGQYGAEARNDYANWMTRHMAEEHRVDGWDTGSFFALHDYDDDGFWRSDEIMRTYGLMDESNKHVTHDRKDEAVREVLNRIDTNNDGAISRIEWADFIGTGATLPDLGFGPGHHGDDEYEYEIHHWEKYHDENTKLEDLTHPEDIAHFKHHEEMEDEEHRIEEMEKQPIIEANIPAMFRRQ